MQHRIAPGGVLQTVVSMFDDPDGGYEILDTNLTDDPFKPDIVVMDTDK